jgi:CBS domain-containing protein
MVVRWGPPRKRPGGPIVSYSARDIMIREVICVQQDMDLRDLARLFLEKGITGAPVLDQEGNLAGVISQTDLLYYQLARGDELILESDFYQSVKVEGRHLPAGFQVEDVNVQRVADVMTPVVHSVLETSDVDAVARMMTRKHIHRVIVRRGRKVAGIITALDVLRMYGRAVAAGRAVARGKARATPPAAAARAGRGKKRATKSRR